MNKTVAVLTPTYNRAYIIEKLFRSLQRQTSRDFVWYIVDDGSTDDTEERVNALKGKNVRINYYKKNNGGKHTALNLGIQQIKEDLTFIVDSDDWLTDDAIETICLHWEKYKAYPKIAGLSYYRMYPDKTVIGNKYPKDGIIDTYTNLRVNQHIKGDKAEVYLTSLLKERPFPVVDNERFMSEATVWNLIAKDGYKLVYIGKSIYICEYRTDGLSYAGKKLMLDNPIGGMEHAKSFMFKDVKWTIQYKYMMLYICMSRFAGMNTIEAMKEIDDKHLLFALGLVPGVLLEKYWHYKYYR